ncbi:MAG: hypothetical protein JO076_13000, partial [Verrucomicrobia bacterium]|nr:hypothetical protein [Verrucomicrobiota bacterium]
MDLLTVQRSELSRRNNSFEGSAFFHKAHFSGRKAAILDVTGLIYQRLAAKTPFLLILGAGGCGKSSLVRCGIPDALKNEQDHEIMSWRDVVTHPASGGTAGSPLAGLSAALLSPSALPECSYAEEGNGWHKLELDLAADPKKASFRLAQTLHFLRVFSASENSEEETDSDRDGMEDSDLLHRRGALWSTRPQVYLLLVIDQLEELLTGGFPVEAQQQYLTALIELARTRQIFVLATLKSEFYDQFEQLCGFDRNVFFTDPYTLCAPTLEELLEIVRASAKSFDLTYEADPKTGKGLDVTIAKAAMAATDGLALLQYRLLQLYKKPLLRGNGGLRWSDYDELGQLEDALPSRAEQVFEELDPDAKAALEPLIGKLLSARDPSRLVRRIVPLRDLVASSGAADPELPGAGKLIERFVEEGFLNREADPKGEMLISISQDAFVRNWPRLCRLPSPEFFLMRDRLEAPLYAWVSSEKKRNKLLTSRNALVEAKILLQEHRNALTAAQVEYLETSLAARTNRRVSNLILLFSVFALAIAFTARERMSSFSEQNQASEKTVNTRIERTEGELKSVAARADSAQRSADSASESPRSQQKATVAQKNAEKISDERDAFASRVRESEQKANTAQKAAVGTVKDPDSSQAQLADSARKTDATKENLAALTNERNSLQAQLKEVQPRAESAQNNEANTPVQLTSLQTQLRETEQTADAAQKAANQAVKERNLLQAQLIDSTQKTDAAQKSVSVLVSEREALKTELQQLQSKADAAEKIAATAPSQIVALQNQLSASQQKADAAKENANQIGEERDVLQSTLTESGRKVDAVQKSLEALTQERNGLRAQLKEAQSRAESAEKIAANAPGQFSSLQSQLRASEQKADAAQKSADEIAKERDSLQTELAASANRIIAAQKSLDELTQERNGLQGQLKEVQSRAESAQKIASNAPGQIAALQERLSASEQKADAAQKSADEIAKERDDLQTESATGANRINALKKSLDELTNERNELQTRLLGMRSSAESLQKIAANAPGQISSLLNQLRETQKKADLAQKNADEISTERDALQAAARESANKIDTVQRSLDELRNERNGLQGQLKEVQSRADAAQKIAAIAPSQIAALQSQLRESQQRADSAQKNVVETAALRTER